MSEPTAKEIREAYAEYRQEWQDDFDEGDTDMRYIAGDPWDPDDRAAREDAGRPCLSLDEINQYLNQYINNLRQSPRAVELLPKGDGANDDDAKRRQGIIRGIEDAATQGPYITAAECAAQRGFGAAVIRTVYNDDRSFDQTIEIHRIANPCTVVVNPHFKTADGSDISDGFLIDRMTKEKFKAKYKGAKLEDFDSEDGVGEWLAEKTIQEAEYWKTEHEYSKLLLVDAGAGLVIASEDEFAQIKDKAAAAGGKAPLVKRTRTVEIPKVVQYMTNGLEILEKTPWAGSRIPLVLCFGKEIYLPRKANGAAKRCLLSLIRLARDPQMLFAYLATQECEEAGMVPKVPFIGAVGQFESDEDTWKNLNKAPHAFAQYDIIIDGTTGAAIPPPSRPQYIANFEQYEVAKESARRSIQAAMGIMPLPTTAQKNNEKSGVALERIQTSEQIGSFHFSDNYDRFLHNMGWQLNELITPIYDTAREVPISKPDGKASTLHLVGNTSHPLNEQGAYDVQGLPEDHYHTGRGEFNLTISTGPRYQSQREEQSDFVDHLIANWQALAISPAVANKVLAKAIRMKDLGPVGEDIATFLDPPDPNGATLPPQAQAMIAQLQSQLQQLQQENTALHMDRAGRVLEQQTKIQLEKMKGDLAKFEKNVDYITKVVVAQLAAKSKADEGQAQRDAQRELAELGFGHDQIDRAHDAAHDVAMTGLEHDNALDAADQAAQHGLVAQQAAAAQQPEPGA